MKTAGVADLKAHLSRHLRVVRAGEEVVITDRGVPVAKVVPLDGEARRGSRRQRLIGAGALLPGRGRIRASLLRPPTGPRLRASLLQALLEEREQGR